MSQPIKFYLLAGILTFSSALVTSSYAQPSSLISQTVKCNAAGSTAEMKKCADESYQAADRKLNQVYQSTISRLTGEEKNRLIQAQRAWIPFRDKTCSFEAAEALGGTLEGLLYTGCLERLTTERTTYLQKVFSARQTNQPTNNNFPQVATVKNLVQGDIMCYATLVDERNTQRQVGASFEICNQRTRFLNKKVRLTYTMSNVNDCQSNEPCGKTRREMLITRMEIVR